MATKAKSPRAKKIETETETETELEAQVPNPGRFKRNTAGYRFKMIIGQPPSWSEVIHNLKPMDDVTLLTYQRDMVMNDALSDAEKIPSTLELITRIWCRLVESVEGYDGIPDGEAITDEYASMVPFEHINQAMTLVFADVGVIAGSVQKN